MTLIPGYGQEKDTTTAGLAKMNAVLHGWATTNIMSGNTFSDPQYFEEGSDETVLRRFDYIVANPPFSIKNWTDGVKEYGRFDGYGERPPEKNGDYAWLMHILKSLKRTGILIQFEGIELIDKYDVYQALLAYWLEVMSDDVYLLIHDGYEVGRELSYEYVVKTKTVDGKTDTEVTDKVKSWDGKLIPKSIIIDTYFAEEAKAIDAAEVIIADTQAQIDELLESAEDGSAIAELMDEKGKVAAKALKAAIDEIRSKIQSEEIDALTAMLYALPMKKKDMDKYLAAHPLCASARNDKGNVNASSIKVRIAELRATTPVPEKYAEDYEQLMSLYTLMTKNDEQSKLVKALKAALEQLVKDKYTVLTVEEIKELLVNKKWYYSIFDGIDALYVAISHSITDRIVELAERYEDTLPTLSAVVDDYEARVKSHLERMGFKW